MHDAVTGIIAARVGRKSFRSIGITAWNHIHRHRAEHVSVIACDRLGGNQCSLSTGPARTVHASKHQDGGAIACRGWIGRKCEQRNSASTGAVADTGRHHIGWIARAQAVDGGSERRGVSSLRGCCCARSCGGHCSRSRHRSCVGHRRSVGRYGWSLRKRKRESQAYMNHDGFH